MSRVPLPADLAAAAPTWRAIAGSGPSLVWFAGDNGAVAQWDGMQLKSVPLVVTTDPALMSQPGGMPNWVGVAVQDAMNNEVVFASGSNVIGRYKSTFAGVQVGSLYTVYNVGPNNKIMANPTIALSSVHCMSTLECWFAGYDSMVGGYLMQSYNNSGTYYYSDYSLNGNGSGMPITTSPLRGVWAALSGTTRQVMAVGAGGTVLYSDNSEIGNIFKLYPKFSVLCSSGSCSPAMSSVDLSAVAGTSVTDLWLVGAMGTLFSFDATAMNPYNPKPSGTTMDLTSVFSLGDRLYAAGRGQALISLSTK
jgi:hypothetical protein